jgi:hypothetical protein
MFHPEVVHTPGRREAAANFVHNIAGLKGDWTMAAYRKEGDRRIREQVGDRQGDLRAVRRRRFLGCGVADPRGDRRSADLHPRRSRPDAHERGRRGGPCSASITTSRW